MRGDLRVFGKRRLPAFRAIYSHLRHLSEVQGLWTTYNVAALRIADSIMYASAHEEDKRWVRWSVWQMFKNIKLEEEGSTTPEETRGWRDLEERRAYFERLMEQDVWKCFHFRDMPISEADVRKYMFIENSLGREFDPMLYLNFSIDEVPVPDSMEEHYQVNWGTNIAISRLVALAAHTLTHTPMLLASPSLSLTVLSNVYDTWCSRDFWRLNINLIGLIVLPNGRVTGKTRFGIELNDVYLREASNSLNNLLAILILVKELEEKMVPDSDLFLECEELEKKVTLKVDEKLSEILDFLVSGVQVISLHSHLVII
jgi:hypothetical protein